MFHIENFSPWMPHFPLDTDGNVEEAISKNRVNNNDKNIIRFISIR